MHAVTIYTNENSRNERWSAERVMRWLEGFAKEVKQDANRLRMTNSNTTVVVHDCEVF